MWNVHIVVIRGDVKKLTYIGRPFYWLQGALDPKVILDLFSMYRDWQEDKVHKITHRQEEIENKIEVVDALSVKLLQRYNGSVSAMKTASLHLSEVHSLQVELGELKGRLTEVISNCDTLCRRIASDGPESLRASIKPFSASTTDVNVTSNLCPGAADTSQLIKAGDH
ncbi:uncharacterized protein LOC104889561 isoform X3 [Beta vulgaris subsp. vulgaris]|uniref:uncharacterized protein LOC104889561 isoform X3 n=1 Tax=Beta vulgaris subsp. vulgaris TaxID=3555 RepID=UPI000540114C|nr:uncharacterized protein LOC104889561 isoform X3 [Beta vulgaris subsp. vulgaris]